MTSFPHIGVKFELPIMSGLERAIAATKVNFKKVFSLKTFLAQIKMGKVVTYLPEFIGRMALENVYSNVDLLFSNVPFVEEPWYLFNKEVVKYGVFAHTQYEWKLFFVATTYRKKLRLTAIANENMKMDVGILLDIAIKNLKQEISQFSKTE